MRCMRWLIMCVCLWSVSAVVARAQFVYTWEQFEEDYLYNTATTEDNGAIDEDLLRDLYAHPINLNTADRDVLEQLPFLDDAQISAFLDYRAYNGPLLSLGELMLVWRMDWKTRCYMSLFTYCDPPDTQQDTWRDRLLRGKHEVSTRMDIPLYTRRGQQRLPETEAHAKTQWYLGNKYYHNLKYGYNYKNQVRYGIQMEKDAGEPFAQWGNKGFDAYSLHASYKHEQGKWHVVLGDYRIHQGLGLVVGNGFMLSTKSFSQSRVSASLRLSPHTSMSEGNFLRGAAMTWRWAPKWQLLSYAAVNPLDATLDSVGRIKTISNTGLHRTHQELMRKGAATASTLGVGLQYGFERRWLWGIAANVMHYNKAFAPPTMDYQQWRYPDQTHVNLSAYYAINKTRWLLAGELAFDKQGDIAYLQTAELRLGKTWRTTAIARYYSSAYQAYLSKAAQSGGKVQNEWGLRLTASGTLRPYLTLDTYLDAHLHPEMSVMAGRGAWGGSAGAAVSWKANEAWAWQMRYALTTARRNVAGTKGQLQALHTSQQWRVQAEYTPREYWSLRSTLGVRAYHSPTKGMSWGVGWTTRCNWQNECWRIAASAAVFSSDDGYTRLSAYEPNLRYTSGFNAFSDQGFRLTALAEYLWQKRIGVGAKMGCTHYFNRNEIGTGPQLIAGRNKADVSLQVRVLW